MSIRILNWNTEFVSPRAKSDKFELIRALVASCAADLICLTEAYPETMPELGQTITSTLSGAGKIENRGGRKVVLWSRSSWSNVDAFGSPDLPPGRYIQADTLYDNERWSIVGLCVPYHAYRTGETWGEERHKAWEGACRFLDALGKHVLAKLGSSERTIILGDFNLQIPAFNYPYPHSQVNQKRKETFKGWLIPTSGIRKRFIDHVAMSADLGVESLHFISKIADDGTQLSDHNGVVLDVAPV